MFGIGLPEMLMIGVVALVVLGPDRLPEAARSLGRAISDIRRATEPARSAWQEIRAEVDGVVNATGGVGNPWAIHPVLQKMTPEERESYMKGGELPPHVAEELDREEAAKAAREAQSPMEEIDYPIPQGVSAKRSAVDIADLSYPAPVDGRVQEERS